MTFFIVANRMQDKMNGKYIFEFEIVVKEISQDN
jgi:hypothetical protein